MGAQLVGEVLRKWTHVSDVAFRVLIRMCVTALDVPSETRPAERYFGGRDLLAMALREPFPPGDDEASRKARDYQHIRVRKAIKELIEDGAIARSGIARDGHNQEYRVLVRSAEPRLPPRPAVKRGGTRVPRTEDQGSYASSPQGSYASSPQGSYASSQRGATPAPPRRDGGGPQELSEEEGMDLRTAVTVPRATGRDEAQNFSAGDEQDQRGTGGAVSCRRCSAFYVDDDGGRQAHEVVFGHVPPDRIEAAS